MAASADLIVNIVTKMSGDGMKQAEKSTSKFKSGLSSASKVAGAALIGIGAAAIGAANAAAEDAQSQAILANAMKNGADASKGQIAATEDWIDAQSRATGVTDDDLRPALAQLVRATGDVGKAQKLAALAMDISAGTGKSLESVTQALVKAQNGSVGGLARLGVATKNTTKDTAAAAAAQTAAKQAQLSYSDAVKEHGKNSTEAAIAQQKMADANRKVAESADKTKTTTKSLADITKELHKQYDGAGKAAGETAAGKMKRFENSLGETQEAIGGALLPVVDRLSGTLMTLGQWAQDHGTMFAIIVGSVALFAAAIVALNLAVTIYTAVTTLAASATIAAWVAAALPIVLVVAAVLAVVAVVVILWKKSTLFRKVVLGVWSAIKTGAAAMGRVLVGAWQKVSTAATTMARIVRNVWSGIRSAAQAVGTFVRNLWRGIWSAIAGFVRAYFNTYKAIFTAIRAATTAALTFIRDRFSSVWNAIKAIVGTLTARVQAVMATIRSVASNAFSAVKTAAEGAVRNAVSAFQTLPGKVKSAFTGAASLLYGIGRDIVQGLVNGILNAAGAVTAAVQHLIGLIPKKVRSMMGISSPSKVMKKLGHDIIKGLEVGMADGVAGVQKVTQHAVDVITATVRAGTKNTRKANRIIRAAIKSIGDESDALVKNAQRRQKIYNGIAAQTARLQEQKQAWRSLKDSVAGTAQQFGSFAGAVGDTLPDLLADMTAKVKATQAFQRTLAALSKLGLNQTTISELAQAGPEDAAARAKLLLAGGKAAVRQVNGLQSQLTSAADTLGSQTADAMYKTGIDATEALLKGLIADKKALERTADRLAKNLAAAVRKSLAKYRVDPKKKKGKSASASTAAYLAPSPTTALARGTTPAGGTTVINVTGAVDPDRTARQIRRILDGHDRRIGMRVA